MSCFKKITDFKTAIANAIKNAEEVKKAQNASINKEIEAYNISYPDDPEEYLKTIINSDRKDLLKSRYDDEEHNKITSIVYRRLRHRYALLKELEIHAQGFLVQTEIEKNHNKESSISEKICELLTCKSKNDNDEKKKHIPAKRAYNLAVTDLFVEKAIIHLEIRATGYHKKGRRLMSISNAIIFFGTFFAILQIYIHIPRITLGDNNPIPKPPVTSSSTPSVHNQKEYLKISKENAFTVDISTETSPAQQESTNSTEPAWLGFTRSFSALGMIVILAVRMSRYGKALLDQGERLLERRHALRQGRLFVHLNDGKLNIDQLDEAFNWNVSGVNAFGNIPTESQAPWGTVLKDVLHRAPELVKTGFEAIKSPKKN